LSYDQQDKRYDDTSKDLWCTLRLIVGPRVCEFVTEHHNRLSGNGLEQYPKLLAGLSRKYILYHRSGTLRPAISLMWLVAEDEIGWSRYRSRWQPLHGMLCVCVVFPGVCCACINMHVCVCVIVFNLNINLRVYQLEYNLKEANARRTHYLVSNSII
jgi:hypothetical protein